MSEEDRALEELLERAQKQDADAETELYDRHCGFVRRRLESARSRRNWSADSLWHSSTTCSTATETAIPV